MKFSTIAVSNFSTETIFPSLQTFRKYTRILRATFSPTFFSRPRIVLSRHPQISKISSNISGVMFACSQDKYPRGYCLHRFDERKFGGNGEPVPYGHRIRSNETNGREEQNDILYTYKPTTERITKASTYPRGDDNSSTKPRHAPLPTFAFRRSRVTVRDNRRGIFRGRIILRWGGDCSTIFPPLYSPTLRISLGSIASSFERGGYRKRNHYYSLNSQSLEFASL